MQGFSSSPISPGPVPQPSSTGGIAAGLLSAGGPLTAAQARTQLNIVRKKWRKEGYSVVGTISFAVLIVAFILLLVMLSRMLRTKRVVQSGCNTAVCRRYAEALEFSRQQHADPCFSFYRFVCGNWAQRRFDSVLDVLLETFQAAVVDMAVRTQAPAQFQNPSQRAARAYTSCIAVLDKKDREVGELKAILFNADLRWPQPASTGNVLSPFIYLCKDWSLLFIFGFTKNIEGGYTLAPTRQFDKLLQVWEQALYSSKHTSLFNILYEDHVTDESTAIKYTQMAIPREQDDRCAAQGQERQGPLRLLVVQYMESLSASPAQELEGCLEGPAGHHLRRSGFPFMWIGSLLCALS
ncbi:hypothetical protein HPB50_026033 [Hyalomma asiaticum]|uniref:Uncharacterized protein n=1 Tax=Hyalomma asiaticum TaxID=266040 RepID=A0ACB7TQW1_HYAAI|nr:hypothetical protein HPB50_026033 [Hyalomma asiaticum]